MSRKTKPRPRRRAATAAPTSATLPAPVPAVVWGTSEIAKLINRTETQAGYLLRQGEIKCAIKKGTLWCASVEALRREFSGEVAS